MSGQVSRRGFFRLAALSAAGVALPPALALAGPAQGTAPAPPMLGHGHGVGAIGDVDLKRAGIDPMHYLTHFDWGKETKQPNGRTLREFKVVATNRDIEIAPGVTFAAWTYNAQVPGPTLRAREGDHIRVHFINAGSHEHNMHFHGFHAAGMDGVEPVARGKSFVYEFDAEPFGLHLYHCHTQPLKRHIHKGLYGTFIVDPPQGRPPARELVMMMNGFDTNFDNENEAYAVNTVPFYYAKHPIPIKQDELVRVYLVNITEFDPINSFHLHANFFNVYRTGTRLTPSDFADTVMLCQGERAILEFTYKRPGRFMFHAHQSEFVELGWMSFFEVTANGAA
jgi:FtsP/CotA-like multicopper oxidase with cupredoxin domain